MRRLILALLLTAPLAAVAEIREAPPHAYQPEKAMVEPQMLGDARTPTYLLALPAPAAAEQEALKQHNQSAGKGQPLKIGFGRDLEKHEKLALAALAWADIDSGRVTRIKVSSPGAAAVRVAMSLAGAPEGLELRFQGGGREPGLWTGGRGRGGRTGRILVTGNGRRERADRALFLPKARSLDGASLSLTRLSHLLAAGTDLHPNRLKTLSQIGNAASCSPNFACVSYPSGALTDASRAVAHLVFTSGSSTYVCTGTMLNSIYADGSSTQIPYLYTAYHCIGNQTEANTLNTWWFFQAATCGSTAVPSGYQVVGGGATLLYAAYDTDTSFMRLNSAPPAGAYFAGWNAATVASGTPAMILHHPAGDLKKFSQGDPASGGGTQGYARYGSSRSADFITMRYTSGSTEGGSSGGGLFTYNASGYYQLRGGLLGGDALCTNMAGLDYFSPMDKGWSSLSQYLTPSSGGTSTSTVWEFYNSILNHYFVTAMAAEANGIDSGGAGPGWSRTGYTFKAYPLNGSSGSPVCRFYGAPPVNSHFYIGNPAECAGLMTVAGLKYEGLVFNLGLPSGTSCASGTVPVYRAYNNGYVTGAGANHRYMTSYSVYQNMVSAGWVPEGIAFCSAP